MGRFTLKRQLVRDIERIAVLVLPYYSASLSYRVYEDQVGDEVLLAWWLRTCREKLRGCKLYILTSSAREQRRVAESVRGLGTNVEILTTRSWHVYRRLLEVMERASLTSTVVLPLGFCMAPGDLLERICEHHERFDNPFTTAPFLPFGVAPMVLSAGFLNFGLSLGAPDTPDDIELSLRAVSQVVGPVADDLPFRWPPCEFGEPWETDALNPPLPKTVRIQTRSDVAILNRLALHHGRNGFAEARGILAEWHRQQCRDTAPYNGESPESISCTWRTATRTPCTRRVLFVSNPSAYSGGEASLCELAGHIDKDRYEPWALVGLDGVFAERLRDSGVRVICAAEDFGLDTVTNIRYLMSVFKLVAPDVLHLNGLNGLPTLCAAVIEGLPIIQHVRVVPTRAYIEYIKVADAVVSPSEFISREILRFWNTPDKITIVKDEVNPGLFFPRCLDKGELRRCFGIPSDAIVVTSIARITPTKRVDLVLDSSARLRQSGANIHILLVGEVYDTEYADRITQMTAVLGLTDCITWIQFVEDIRPIHAMSDVFVLCSEREGLGRSVAEAMAMGVPVVVAADGGATELVGRNGERGAVIQGPDPEAIARAVSQFLQDQSYKQTVTSEARSYIEKHLNPTMAARSIMGLYDTVLKSRDMRRACP